MLLVHLLQQQKDVGLVHYTFSTNFQNIHFLQIFKSEIYKTYVTIIRL